MSPSEIRFRLFEALNASSAAMAAARTACDVQEASLRFHNAWLLLQCEDHDWMTHADAAAPLPYRETKETSGSS